MVDLTPEQFQQLADSLDQTADNDLIHIARACMNKMMERVGAATVSDHPIAGWYMLATIDPGLVQVLHNQFCGEADETPGP